MRAHYIRHCFYLSASLSPMIHPMHLIRATTAGSLSALLMAGVAMTALLPSVAQAQVPVPPSRLPGSIDPGRADERLVPMAPAAPRLETDDARPAASAPVLAPAVGGFVLRSAAFENGSAFSDETLITLMRPYLGKDIDETGAQALADYLTAYYRQEGYFLSKVFVQDIDPNSGTVTFLCVEGYIEQLSFDNADVDLASDWQNIVTRAFDRIRGMKPLHGPTLERQLLLLNDMYGLDASTTLVPLTDMPNPPVGAVGMVVSLQKKDRLSSVEFNNYGSIFSGPGQGAYNFNMGTPLHAFDNLRIQIMHAFPFDEMRYAHMEYSIPVGADGLMLSARAGRSLFRPTNNLKPLELKSASESVGIELAYPLIRARAENLYLRSGFEIRNSHTDFLATELYDDRLRTVNAEVSYEFLGSDNSQNIISTTITQGLDILGARETGSLNLSRREGHSDFTKVEASATRVQPVVENVSIVGGVRGQYAFSQLLSSEEFGYGGQGMGRAYDTSEIVGDHGVSGFAEVRYSGIPPVQTLKLALQPYAFYDIGKVWNIENGEDPESGASTGAGIRFSVNNNINGNLHAAFPLTRRVANPKDGDGDDMRVFFQIGATF